MQSNVGINFEYMNSMETKLCNSKATEISETIFFLWENIPKTWLS